MVALPAAARAISDAATDGVAAARAADAAAFGEAVGRLGAADPQRVALVLGGVVRSLLEERHPDGMDGEDVRGVLERCVRAAAVWDSGVDPQVLLVVLTGALGLSDPDEQPAYPPGVVARDALLLTVDLLGPRPVGPYLAAAFAELARAETVEMP
jgi:hypothetical protein